jgi:hypothetical protein
MKRPPLRPLPFRLGRIRFVLLVLTGVLAMGCEDETTQPEDDSLDLPPLTNPEAVLSALPIIYNDRDHGAEERLLAYASLLDSSFVFHFQPSDIASGLPKSWGLEEELAF